MAHLFKPTIVYYVDTSGRRVAKDIPGAQKTIRVSRKWYAKGSPLPKGKKVPLTSDLGAARQMLAELVKQADRDNASALAAVVNAWPRLPAHVRSAIAELVNKAKQEA